MILLTLWLCVCYEVKCGAICWIVQIVGQIIPKGIVVIPGTDGMQLLLFHDSMYISNY